MKDEVVSREDRVASLNGMGCSRKRVEDARFTQGKGNYVDDIKLDGMLFMILDLIGFQHWPQYVLVTHPFILLSGLTGLFIAPGAYLRAIDDIALKNVLNKIRSIKN